MRATINTTLLSQLGIRNKPYDVRDDKLKGFLVRVNISGKLLYMCEYSRGKRVSIGRPSVLTPTQARDIAKSILGDFAKGIDPKDKREDEKNKKKSSITLKEFIDNEYGPWVKEHRKVGAKTLAHINRCFVKAYSNKPLTEITPALIDQWRTQRLKEGSSTETVNRYVATFKAALSKAVLWEFIRGHPLEKLKLLKVDRVAKVRFLSEDEEKSLRKAIKIRDEELKAKRDSGNKWKEDRGHNDDLLPDLKVFVFADHMPPMILLSINTGLRQGELFNLQWNNINFTQSILTIEGSYAKSGKTRHIPLNTEALYVLKAWRKQSTEKHFVFLSKNNKSFDNVKKAWAGILNRAEITNFRWHDMRHHFASKLVMVGVDLNTVRELLGHADMTMTLRYAHLAPEHKANAVEKLVTQIAF